MDPEPMTEEAIKALIIKSRDEMNVEQKRLWDVIQIEPEKWQRGPWSDATNGFWAVATIGKTVIWYNEIEEGFNQSSFKTFGEIGEYWCNQDELRHVTQQIMYEIHGTDPTTPSRAIT